MKKLFIAITLAAMLTVTGCGGSSNTETTAAQTTAASTQAPTETEVIETEAEIVNNYVWDAGSVAYLGLDRDEIWEIYDDFMGMLNDDAFFEAEDADAYTDECTEAIAEKYGISTDDVDQIFFASASPFYYATFDPDAVKLKYGDLQDLRVNGKTIIIKAKIAPSFTNNMTIEQNYFTVCYFIRDYLDDEDYDEIQYWAVADMTDGSESKCISFTVPKGIIQAIQSGDFIDNQLGDYVDDLWILPSLRQ